MKIDFEKLPRFKSNAMQILNLIPEWAEAFDVDRSAIERQIPIAHAWCNANAKKAPKKNAARFLHTWMKKAKEYGNLARVAGHPRFIDSPKPEADMTMEEMHEIRRRNFPQRGMNAVSG